MRSIWKRRVPCRHALSSSGYRSPELSRKGWLSLFYTLQSIYRLCGPAIHGKLLSQQERTGPGWVVRTMVPQEFGQELLSHPCRALSAGSAGFHQFVILHFSQYFLHSAQNWTLICGVILWYFYLPLRSLLSTFVGVWTSSGRTQEQPQQHGWNGEKIWFCWNQTTSFLAFSLPILSLVLLLGEWVSVWCLVVVWVWIMMPVRGFPKQHPGRGIQAGMQASWSSLTARGSPNLLFFPLYQGFMQV